MRKLLSQKYFAVLLITLGIIGISVGAFLFLHKPTLNKINSDPAYVDVNTSPSSAKPSQQTINTYHVPAATPRYIVIPAINVTKTPVIALGLLKSGAIATPNNIYEAGWYEDSSKPGQNGAMFIYGHVSSWQADGIFYNLKKLKSGDKIFITRGDNKQFIYQVVSSKIYPYNKVGMNQVLSPIEVNKPGLNLMTCAGKVIKGTSEFSERLVVFTTLMNP